MIEYIAYAISARQRRRSKTQTNDELMQRYLASPLPHPSNSAWDTAYLVLDMEMSGLDTENDHILSAGWVVVENGQIDHQTAEHHYVTVDAQHIDLSESGPIHKISHAVLSSGITLKAMLDKLLQQLIGRVLVVHHAPLDVAFLSNACERAYGVAPRCTVIDTLRNEQLKLARQNKLDGASLRLTDCRRRYNLPNYLAHNAIIDALATAELWLAQLAYAAGRGKRDSPPLKYFL
jgi:DNA polymerase-3 subunit epsilon